jgi:hypothetical protein
MTYKYIDPDKIKFFDKNKKEITAEEVKKIIDEVIAPRILNLIKKNYSKKIKSLQGEGSPSL